MTRRGNRTQSSNCKTVVVVLPDPFRRMGWGVLDDLGRPDRKLLRKFISPFRPPSWGKGSAPTAPPRQGVALNGILFDRSAVNAQCNVMTPMGGLVTGTIVLLALEFLSVAFQYIPSSALGAVIIMAVINLFDFQAIKGVARVNGKPVLLLHFRFDFLQV